MCILKKKTSVQFSSPPLPHTPFNWVSSQQIEAAQGHSSRRFAVVVVKDLFPCLFRASEAREEVLYDDDGETTMEAWAPRSSVSRLSSVRPLSSLRYFRADPLCKHGMNGGRDAQSYSFVRLYRKRWKRLLILISDCKMYCPGMGSFEKNTQTF